MFKKGKNPNWDEIINRIENTSVVDDLIGIIKEELNKYMECSQTALFPWKILVERILRKFYNDIESIKRVFLSSLIPVEYKPLMEGSPKSLNEHIIRSNNELIESLCGYHVWEVLESSEFTQAIGFERNTTKGYTFTNCVCWPRYYKYPSGKFTRVDEDAIRTLKLLLKVGCSLEKRNEENGGETCIRSLLEAIRAHKTDIEKGIEERLGLKLYRTMMNIHNYDKVLFTKMMNVLCNKIGSIENSSTNDYICWAFTQEPTFVSNIIFEHIYKTIRKSALKREDKHDEGESSESDERKIGTYINVSVGINRIVDMFLRGPLENIVRQSGGKKYVMKADFSLYFEKVPWDSQKSIETFNSNIVKFARYLKPTPDDNWCYAVGAFFGECGNATDITSYIKSLDVKNENAEYRKIAYMNIISCIAHCKKLFLEREVISYINSFFKDIDTFCKVHFCRVLMAKFNIKEDMFDAIDIMPFFKDIFT
jgi:hypothetical protein